MLIFVDIILIIKSSKQKVQLKYLELKFTKMQEQCIYICIYIIKRK